MNNYIIIREQGRGWVAFRLGRLILAPRGLMAME